jgi:hypothetical protein
LVLLPATGCSLLLGREDGAGTWKWRRKRTVTLEPASALRARALARGSLERIGASADALLAPGR